jgi:class 3 adenylate cyclase
MLNGQFYTLTQFVVERGGLPIKYIGDAFLSVFVVEHHERRAIETALAIKQTASPSISIGIATGEFYLGPIGHPDYAHLDAIGNDVNLAFRIEMWAGQHTQSKIAATSRTTAGLGSSIETGEQMEIQVKSTGEMCAVREIVIR